MNYDLSVYEIDHGREYAAGYCEQDKGLLDHLMIGDTVDILCDDNTIVKACAVACDPSAFNCTKCAASASATPIIWGLCKKTPCDRSCDSYILVNVEKLVCSL